MVFCLPNIAAFAGADVAAGAVSVCLDRVSSYNMLIDLGTNGEIILCNKDGGVAASAACGSAFEGVFSQCKQMYLAQIYLICLHC